MFCEDGVKRGVLGDTSEGDMWYSFVDETARDAFC